MNLLNFIVQWGIFFAIIGIILTAIVVALTGMLRLAVWLWRNITD